MKARFAIAALAGLMFAAMGLAGCHRQQAGAADYFPLKAGAAWTFRFSASTGATGELTTTNLAPARLFGGKVVPQRNSGGARSYTEYFAEDHDGIRHVAIETANGLESRMNDHSYVIKYPIRVGTAWRETERTLDGTTYEATTTIESVTDKVSVPAGTFTGCVRVRSTGSASPVRGVSTGAIRIASREIAVEDNYWLAPGVGPVKGTHDETVGTGVLERSLSFSLELERYER